MHPMKYAVVERERRWLLSEVPLVPDGARRLAVRDRYVDGTRLRLRETTDEAGTVVRKLGQKVRLGPGAGEVAHTSLYLDDAEWDLLVALPARTLAKTRTLVPVGEGHVAVDVHADGTVVAEIDGDGELPAGWRVVREITAEEAWTGGALARTSGTTPPQVPGRGT